MNPRLTPLAAALSIAFLNPAASFAADNLEPVIVTATRFSEPEVKAPANISVITRDDIRNTPATDLPSVLKSSAGVTVRPMFGSLGLDSTVDIRGFGEAASNNTLILLDGQRLNPIDGGSINWSAIPLDSVQRIEIQRGTGTVLFGDKATGGVVNIITDKSGAPRAGATIGLGSYGTQTVDANAATGNETGYFNIFGHYANTNGWRENTQSEQYSLTGRGALYLGQGEGFIDYSVFKNSSGLPSPLLALIPGSMPSSECPPYPSAPKCSRTPNDSQRNDGYRLRPGVSLSVTDSLRFDAEVSLEKQNSTFNYVSTDYEMDRTRDSWSLTPRLRWQHGLGLLKSESVAGIDYYSGKVEATEVWGLWSGIKDSKQDSSGIYFQNITELGHGWSSLLGARHQKVDQSNNLYGFEQNPTKQSRNAWDAGLTYTQTGWRAYGKVGSAFRFPNIDEILYTLPSGLKPQSSNLQELGGSVTVGAVTARASIYNINLTDEIAYVSNAIDIWGTNINLDPTRRRGLELEADWQIVSSLLTRLSYTYTDASFREGAYDGKKVPLVPSNKASAQLTWDGGSIGKYTAVANYVGKQYYANDFANEKGELASHTTLDLMAAWNFKPWSISARLLNAFDKIYSPYSGYSFRRSDYYYYPADGRTFLMTATYNFR